MPLVVLALFALYLVLNTAFVKVSVGLPLKDLVLVALFGLIFIAYNRQVLEFFRRHLAVVGAFLVFAVLGFSLTILNDRELGVATELLLKVIVQPFLILVCTYALSSVVGFRVTAALFACSAGLTGIFAILQSVGLDPAWQVRDFLSNLQNETAHIRGAVKSRARPMGLSLTPIVYSYHIAAAYIAMHFLYRNGFIKRPIYYLLLSAILLMAAANATRSLVLGILIHEAIHQVYPFRLNVILGAIALGIVGIIGFAYLESIGSRLTSVGDASAVGRLMLYDYGLRLAADFPFGLGWGFDPVQFAWLYWEHLSQIGRAEAAFHLALHNACLNFFLAYGSYGVAMIAVMALVKPKTFATILLFATAYLLHAFFHNDGLFLGDDYFWFAFAIFLAVRDARVTKETPWSPRTALPLRAHILGPSLAQR
jgi:hypothetical protein